MHELPPFSQAQELSKPCVVGRREIVVPAAQHAMEAVSGKRHAGKVRLAIRAADLVHDGGQRHEHGSLVKGKQ